MLHGVRTAAFFLILAGALTALRSHILMIPFTSAQTQQAPAAKPGPGAAGVPGSGAAQQPAVTPAVPIPAQTAAAAPHTGLTVVVLDPAHGGTDPGARGTGGIRESELVLSLAAQIRAALEKQGFSVLLTRQGNDNPSFDDRSAIANAQRGAIFVTLHIGSTGLPGSVRVYTLPDFPGPAAAPAPGALLPWDRAQAGFLPLSRKLAELAQGELAQRFKGSPGNAQTAPVRQLRTVAAPAMAIELSSISIEDQNVLEQMGPGVGEALARAVVAFKPLYEAAAVPGAGP